MFKATGGQCTKKATLVNRQLLGGVGNGSPLFLRAGKKLPVKIEGLCKWFYFPSHFPYINSKKNKVFPLKKLEKLVVGVYILVKNWKLPKP